MALHLHTDNRGTGGTPILFAHSFAGDCSHWNAAQEHLKAIRRVVAFDFSGHGQSPGAIGAYTFRELAKDISAVADAQRLDKFVLVGHSMGASIAAEYAGSHALRVKALVLVDAPPAPGTLKPDQIEQFKVALHQDPYPFITQYWQQQMFIDTREDVKHKLLDSLQRLSRKAAIELTEESFSFDATAPLHRYPGTKFAIVTPRNNAPLSLHNAVPGFRHAVLPGTGHWIQLDKPDEFNGVLDGFLSSI